MKTLRAAAAITVMAAVGLVVSVISTWSQLTPDSPGREELGPPVAQVTQRLTGSPDERVVRPTREVGRLRAGPSADGRPQNPPVRITVDAVGIDAVVRPVGVAADGQMQLPPDPRLLGWYQFRPPPDGVATGSAVLAGHLDSLQYGLGPLVRLRDIETGDLVEVTLLDRSTTTYQVNSVDSFEQQRLPAELFARSGEPRLRIITCGGDYDVDSGGYQENLVVTAVPA